ncbi:MAG: hypothetical protein ABH867_04380 [Patescibacteria group bacterium]
MKTKIIKAIFTNLLFVIGVVLMVVGFVRGVSTVVKSAVFEKYPLNDYEETRCQTETFPRVVPLEGAIAEPLSEQEKKEIKADCFKSLEQARKVKQVDDITYSLSFLASGLALTLIFKRFIFSKKKVTRSSI